MGYVARWADNKDKLSKFEIAKLSRDGLDVLADIEKYAKEGFESIPKSEFDLLKWAGVYLQKPKSDGFFLMRVRIPSGNLTSEQAKVLAGISKDYGRDLVDVSTRQAIQFHWLQIEDFPDIFARLDSVGLSSFESCGDCPRTIIGNPLAGIDPNELLDTRPLVAQLSETFLLNRDFSNLPRKYKISISSNYYNPGHAEINDIAFTPAVKIVDGKEVVGFHVWVGGGLSAKPFLAQQLDVFVAPDQVVKVAIGVTSLFRDYGYREKRHQARLKFLVNDWGAEKFKEKLVEEYVGELPSRGEDKTLGWNAGYFTGVHRQKQEGLSYVGLSLPVGRFTADELFELARLSEEYGDGSLRTCNSQNIIIANIPNEKVENLLKEKVLQRLTPFPKKFTAFAVSCTGNEFCNLAIVETKARLNEVVDYLDERLQLDVPLRLNMVGCPNSCGHRQIADIGFQGSLLKTPEGMKDAFEFYIGGTLGPGATFNKKLKGKVLGEELKFVVLHLVHFFLENKKEGEKFFDFANRVGLEIFQDELNKAQAARP